MNIKIALMSDLHLDVGNFKVDPIEADLCIIAGDVCEVAAGSPIEWAKRNIPNMPVYFIPGNHDFYGGRIGNVLNRWRKQVKNSNVHLLYNEVANFGSINIIGSPLWSGLNWVDPIQYAHLIRILKFRIADFSCIYTSGGAGWEVSHMLYEFKVAVEFLERELAKQDDKFKLVVTHWAPSKQSISSQFEGEELNPYFINDLPDLVKKSNLWIHGHTHDPFDYRLGNDPNKGRVICHPRGYPSEFKKREKYKPKIIEIKI